MPTHWKEFGGGNQHKDSNTLFAALFLLNFILNYRNNDESVRKLIERCMRGDLDAEFANADLDTNWLKKGFVQECISSQFVALHTAGSAMDIQTTLTKCAGFEEEVVKRLKVERLRLEHRRNMIIAEARRDAEGSDGKNGYRYYFTCIFSKVRLLRGCY